MDGREQYIKIIQTYAGNVYAYVPASNQIITLNKAWFDSIDPEKKEETVTAALEAGGIELHSRTEEIDFSFSPEELWHQIEHHTNRLTLEVTQQCSLRCAYCIYSGNYANERTHSGKHMSLEMMKRCIDYYYEHSMEEEEGSIGFYGGESLLQFKEIQQAIEYARNKWQDKSIDFQISTNGTTLTPEVLRWLNEQNDTSISITCNGDMHDEYRRFPDGSGSLEVIMQAVQSIKDCYPDLWTRTYFIANIASKKELLALRRFYMNRIGKPPVAITGIKTDYGNESIQRIARQKDAQDDDREVIRLYCEDDPYITPYINIDGICKRRVGPENCLEKNRSFCMPLANELYIAADGKFRACEQMCSDLEFGSIDSGYDKNSIREMLGRVQEALSGRCRTCWGRRLCYACFADVNVDTQGKPVFPEAACRNECAGIAYALRAFCEMSERNPQKISEIIRKQESMTKE